MGEWQSMQQAPPPSNAGQSGFYPQAQGQAFSGQVPAQVPFRAQNQFQFQGQAQFPYQGQVPFSSGGFAGGQFRGQSNIQTSGGISGQQTMYHPQQQMSHQQMQLQKQQVSLTPIVAKAVELCKYTHCSNCLCIIKYHVERLK